MIASSGQVHVATREIDQALGARLAGKPQKAFATTGGTNEFNKTLVRLGHRVFLTYTVAMTHIRVRLLLGTDLAHLLTVGVQVDITVTTSFCVGN
jgi:hypothetical protein